MGDHPVAGRQVPEGVAIPQHLRREGRRHEGRDRAGQDHQLEGGRFREGRGRRRVGDLLGGLGRRHTGSPRPSGGPSDPV